jgi:hypothetical protein
VCRNAYSAEQPGGHPARGKGSDDALTLVGDISERSGGRKPLRTRRIVPGHAGSPTVARWIVW